MHLEITRQGCHEFLQSFDSLGSFGNARRLLQKFKQVKGAHDILAHKLYRNQIRVIAKLFPILYPDVYCKFSGSTKIQTHALHILKY